MNPSHPHKKPLPGAAVFAPARAEEDSGEGRMGAIRMFVVLSWGVFALRQIFLKPVKILVGKD
jgi:hypothetical protein